MLGRWLENTQRMRPVNILWMLGSLVLITGCSMSDRDRLIKLAESGTIEANAEWQPVIEEFDGVEMALVPAGCFEMGTNAEQLQETLNLCEEQGDDCLEGSLSQEQPAHEVCFSTPFWIDVYEVSNEQYGEYADNPACVLSPSTEPAQARSCLTWLEAETYCQNRDAGLPTEAEWEYAARGPDDLIFPWGNEFDPDKAVYYSLQYFEENHPFMIDVAPVGSKPEGLSWVGAYDMSGNVWEWMDNEWYIYSADPDEVWVQPQAGVEVRMLRGGWFPIAYSLRSAFRNSNVPNGFAGVRCARDYD